MSAPSAESLDQFFLFVMGAIVYLMQMGFGFLEAGAIRTKNVTNILMKNILDSAIAALSYWAVGYAFAYGADSNAFIGYKNFLLIDLHDNMSAFWFFQFVFAATAATIVSGAMAERTNFIAYIVYCTVLTTFVYPIATHWVWDSKGWLLAEAPWDDTSFIDFAGSAVVHCLGGTAALVGAIAVGKRRDLFNKTTERNERIKGHSVPLAVIGGFILMFGFFAFNGGSQLSISGADDGAAVGKSVKNTVLGGLTAGLVAIGINYWVYDRKFSLLTCINANLTGMVTMCAACNAVEDWSAVVMGIIAGPTYLAWSALIFKIGIDDPLDAVAVHLGGGLWGIIAAPIFHKDVGILYNWDNRAGKHFLWNIIGAVVIIAWTAAWCIPMFFGMKFVKILRVTEEVEDMGLDMDHHGEEAYPPEAYESGQPIVSIKQNGEAKK